MFEMGSIISIVYVPRLVSQNMRERDILGQNFVPKSGKRNRALTHLSIKSFGFAGFFLMRRSSFQISGALWK